MSAEAGNLKFRFTSDTSDFTSGISSIKGALQGLAGLAAIDQIIDKFVELSNLDVSLRNTGAAFEKAFKSAPSLLAQLRKSTGGVITDLQLMQQALKAQNLGIDQNQLAKFFEFATIRAAETGESVDYLVTSIVNGVGRRSPLILDNLGIGVNKLGSDFRSAGDAAERVAKIIDEEVAKSALTIEETIKPIERLNSAWKQFEQDFTKSFEGNGIFSKFGRFADQIASVLRLFGDQLNNSGFNRATDIIGDFARNAKDIGRLEQVIDGYREALKKLNLQIQENQIKFRELGGEASDLEIFLEQIKKDLGGEGGDVSERMGLARQIFDATENSRVFAEVLKILTGRLQELKNASSGAGESLFGGDADILNQIQNRVRDIRPETTRWPVEMKNRLLEFTNAAGSALPNVANGMEMVSTSFRNGVDAITQFGLVLWTTLEDGTERILDFAINMQNVVEGAIQALAMGIAEGLANAINGVTEGDNFGKALLRNIGAFMTQLGAALVSIGTAMVASLTLLNNPTIGSAIGAIGAGIALAALGGVLSNAGQVASSGFKASGSSVAAISQSQGDIGGFGRLAEQPEINIFLNGQKLTQGLQRQELYNGRTGG